MRSNHLMNTALVVIAATGITHLVRSERRHRDRTVLETARIHQQLLAAQVERPGLRTIWGTLAHLDPAERRLHVHRHAWVSAWEVMFRVGTLSADQVRSAAEAMFADPGGKKWWERVRDERAQHAADRCARQFHAILDATYQGETGNL